MTNADITTIAQRFLDIATASPDQPALIFPEVTFSYGQLQSLVAAFALRFRAAGLDGSKSVHIRSEDPAVSLPAILAAALLGVRVLVRPSRDDPSLILIATEVPSAGEAHLLVDLSFSPAKFAAEEKTAIWVNPKADANAPWFLCPRSSESGAAHFVGVSQGTMVKRALLSKMTQRGSDPRVAVLVSPTSYHGLAYRLATLITGGSLLEAGSWTFLEANGVTDVILPAAGVPQVLDTVPESDSGIGCTVLGLRLARGEQDALLQRFHEVSVTLDLAETGPVLSTTATSQGRGTKTPRVKWAKTMIADLSGTPASIGRLGIALDEAAREWVWPGIAARQHDQWLEILGAAPGHETIHVGGHDIDAGLIDGVISSTDGIVEAVAFASPKAGHDEILCFAIFEDGVNRHHVVKRVENACREAFGAFAVPARVRPIAAIPRLPSGCTDRKACSEMILSAAES